MKPSEKKTSGWNDDSYNGVEYYFQHIPFEVALDRTCSKEIDVFLVETINWSTAGEDKETVHYNRYFCHSFKDALALAVKIEMESSDVAEEVTAVRKANPKEVERYESALGEDMPIEDGGLEEEFSQHGSGTPLPSHVMPKAHLPEPMTPVLYNAAEMARENPDTFELPSEEELAQVGPHSLVKVAAPPGERFWVFVTQRTGDVFRGNVSSRLITVPLDPGQAIRFHKDNIYQVSPKQVEP